MSRLVVTDTGPLIHLDQADELHLLELTGEIYIPETVLTELEPGSTDISELEVTVEHVEYDESTYPHLDPGETAALVLSVDRDAVLLTDDLDARKTAQDENIEVHGSVGVVLYAYSRGELSETAAKRVLRALKRDTNLYLSSPAGGTRDPIGRFRRRRLVTQTFLSARDERRVLPVDGW